jgi:hypothetical protein
MCPGSTTFTRTAKGYKNDQAIFGPQGRYTVFGFGLHMDPKGPSKLDDNLVCPRTLEIGSDCCFAPGAIQITVPWFDEEIPDPRTACPNCKSPMAEMIFVDRPTIWICPKCMEVPPRRCDGCSAPVTTADPAYTCICNSKKPAAPKIRRCRSCSNPLYFPEPPYNRPFCLCCGFE